MRKKENRFHRNYLQNGLRRLFGGEVLGKLEKLITRAQSFGLPLTDIENAVDSLDHNESAVALDTLLEQLYENDIGLDQEFYLSAMELCDLLSIEKSQYQYLSELVRM